MAAQESTTSTQDLIQLAIRAARSGNKESARVMLRQVYQRDRRNEQAMLWLAKLAHDNEEREQWLTRILEFNPDNVTAQKALEQVMNTRENRNNRAVILYGLVTVIMLAMVVLVLFVALR